jgi:DNA-binding SARP family transcriptional activator/tRNA A-37 threonylcarbamoyl transferase component Bud32/TolB-like protein
LSTDPHAVLARPKLLGLLSFLAAGARGFHRRDSLIGLFWAELDQDRARGAVRQSLYRLRRLLGESVVATRGDDDVALSDSEFWCDVVAFEDALDRGDREAALELYRGDLLQGLYVPDAPEFERWIDERRKQLRERASRAAWELADQEASKRNTAAAGHWTRHARDLAPLDERLLRRVIKLLDSLGDRSGAVREYESFARRLADELELEPSPETEALIESVRSRSAVSPVSPSEPLSPPLAGRPAPLTGRAPARSLEQALADTYRIGREIASGGMATVYLARDLRHDRDVAVKVMHPELASTLAAERFLQEIKIAARLTHPHIVPLYDSGSVDGYLYYVMPYIEGESLRHRLEREKQLPLDEALEIVSEVAEALGRAHELGIVHRDVKPENILFSGGHALVADFGIARAITAAAESRLTRSGMVVGTPSYISPEQGAGASEVDGRTDVYSLGCVLYEMLGGEPPFTGPTPETIARQHVSVAPRSIIDLRPTVPQNVAAAISRALAKTPADRFSRVAQFAEALAPSATRRGARRWSGRRRMVLAATSALLLVVAAVVGRLGFAPELDGNRVVVLPLENRTGDTALALLGSMAADWITQGLQGIDVIEVVPTATGVEPGPDLAGLRGSTRASTARAVGEATGAGTVVGGAYYRRGDSLEFQTQVIDAGRERLLRAVPPVTGAVGATRAVMDTLRRRVMATVASALDYRLLQSSAARPAHRRPWRRTEPTWRGIAPSSKYRCECARRSDYSIERSSSTPTSPTPASSSSWPIST